MRKIVAGLFISLDGVTESPDKWQFDLFDEDMANHLGETFAAQDAMLLGRVTYQEWEPYWPTSKDEPIATIINTMPKYVASNTLDKVSWGQWDAPTLLKGNLAEQITRLKQQPGKNIGIGGSSTLVEWLMQNDLLDELSLAIHPVVVGKGKRLFNAGKLLKRLEVVSSKVSSTGVLIVNYQPKRQA